MKNAGIITNKIIKVPVMGDTGYRGDSQRRLNLFWDLRNE